MVAAALCICTMATVSCSDDDNNTSAMKFSSSKVEVIEDSTQTVKVTGCTTPLTVKSSSDSIATVTADSATVSIKGVKAGTATILVTDSKKLTGTISVTVSKATTK